MVLQHDTYWWEDRSCLAGVVQKKTVAPICQHDSDASYSSTTVLPDTTTAFSCPSGWEQLYDHCFLYVNSGLSWPNAENDCVSIGGHLASIHNAMEQALIEQLVASSTSVTWLGGSDKNTEVGNLDSFFSNNSTCRFMISHFFFL
jgi:hypothetical protein